jgi:hypothetical protein
MNPNNAFAGGHYKKRTTQTLIQQNNCGNGALPVKIDCQNSASQIQGRNNAAAVAAAQGTGTSGNNDNHMPGMPGGDNQGGDHHGGDHHGGDNQGGDNQGGDHHGGDNQGGDHHGGAMMSVN